MKRVITLILLLSIFSLYSQQLPLVKAKVSQNFGVVKTAPLTELAKTKVVRTKGWKDRIIPNKKKRSNSTI